MRMIDMLVEKARIECEGWARNRTLPHMWDECPRGDWLISMARKIASLDSFKWVEVARQCADHVAYLRLIEMSAGASAAASSGAASDAFHASTVSAAVEYALCASVHSAAACAAHAAAAAATYPQAVEDSIVAAEEEQRWQADMIRSLIPNPFKS